MIIESAINATIIAALANATATWTPSGGSATPVTGIFNRPYTTVQTGLMGFESSQPTFEALSGDLSGAAYGDALTVNGENFTVVSVQPSMGITRLLLQEA